MTLKPASRHALDSEPETSRVISGGPPDLQRLRVAPPFEFQGVSWVRRYADKVKTADAAVEAIHSGDRIFLGSGAAEPQKLVEALVRRASAVFGAEVVHLMTLGIAPYTETKLLDNFRHNALFIGPNVREAVQQGRADYTPVFLSEVPHLFETGRIPIDVALIEVSPPDRHGYCSFGVSVDVVKPAAENARIVLAEVNERMPRTLGDSFIHVDDLDAMVPVAYALPEAKHPMPDPISKAIGLHIAGLVEDGSTLQMGVGTIPDSVLHFLRGKKDLGVHTEMFSDGMMDLVQEGVITGKKKSLHREKVIASFCFGTKRLFEFVDNNPFIEFHPSSYTNDPFVIAQNDRMVSINSALQVDLTGQVCADSLGSMFYSGIGGQLDFVRGAARSREGKPIIAFPSTARDGSLSRIVPQLTPGAGVVTTRGDVHYVITEHGVASLHGRTIRERALALIAIADPRFRPGLIREAKKLHYIDLDVPEIPGAGSIYPERWETIFTLRDKTRILLRPIKITDEPMMKELFYRCSPTTIYHRFFHVLKSMPHRELVRFVHLDYRREMAIVGVAQDSVKREREQIVCVGRYFADPTTGFAEVAFLVRDDYQRRGIGERLVKDLVRVAKANGIKGFQADVLGDNVAGIKLFHKLGYLVETDRGENTVRLRVPFRRPRAQPLAAFIPSR